MDAGLAGLGAAIGSQCSACQGSNFECCVWRTVSSHSSHHPQEVLLAQFSLYVHKGGLKPDSFHLSVANGANVRNTCSKMAASPIQSKIFLLPLKTKYDCE